MHSYCQIETLHISPVSVSAVSRSSEEAHVEAAHFDCVVYLRLWSGDLEGALQLATERGELNDHLLSVAPMGTFIMLMYKINPRNKSLDQWLWM